MTESPRRYESEKRLIIFDLDGVILDSRDNMRYAWEKAASRGGIKVTFEQYFSEIGRPFDRIMERLGLAAQSNLLESVFRVSSMERIDLLRFYPQVEATLTLLEDAGFKLGIVTSKDKLRTNAILAMLPVNFTSVQAPDGMSRGKPAPDQLLLAMVQSGVDPIGTLYVGDMDTDHEAARRAGIDYAHASWGYGRPPDDDSWILSDVTDLLELIARPQRAKGGETR